jgi:hypothetical protein
MNSKHTTITSGFATLVAAGLMALVPLQADAANRPSPDANGTSAAAVASTPSARPAGDSMCPAADLVPECQPPAVEVPGGGTGSHPQVVTAQAAGGGGSALLSPDRSVPTPD